METEKEQNWLRGVKALRCLQKPLRLFIDKEIEIFHRELTNECGPDYCVKPCDFKNWKPRPDQRPSLECEVCSRWRDVIWHNHTSQHGKVMWLNSKPHLWSQHKWEVAKVYMPDGHKNNKSVGDFDIAAFLCLMNQCKHFKKFKLGGLCDQVASVRNKIMHAPSFELEQKDLHDYFSRIKELGEVLARHDSNFTNLSKNIDEIAHCWTLVVCDNITVQRNLAQNEKELEDIYFAFVQKAVELDITKMKLERLERQIAQQEQDSLADYYALIHKPRGLCVVINNEVFQRTNLSPRRGSQEDTRALHAVFTRLGFDVVIHNNLTAGDMRRVLGKLGSRNFLDEDALVVCILSHGTKGCVFGTDGKKVYLQELTQPFTSKGAPTLTGKPKLFFIQACQGNIYHGESMLCPPIPRQVYEDTQSHPEEDAGLMHVKTVPLDADFLLGMATVSDFKSFRTNFAGSIYIQELCAQLTMSAESSRNDDILDVLTRVNREVSQQQFLNSYRQIPEPRYTLTKKLVLKFIRADLPGPTTVLKAFFQPVLTTSK